MTDCVQFFDKDGTRVEKFPIMMPQYKVALMLRNEYSWSRLNKDGLYEELGTGSYQAAIYGVLKDCRRVNGKHPRVNWNMHPDLEDKSVLYEVDLTTGPVGTDMYLTVDNKPCQTLAVAAWRLTKEDNDWYSVWRQAQTGIWVQMYEESLYSCRRFLDDQLEGVRTRMIELYRSNRGLGLYRYIAMLDELGTVSILGEMKLSSLVESTINYTSSWTSKAIRVGQRCIDRMGRKTTLPRPLDSHVDWNVTQLTSLCRLENGEVEFLVSRGLISPLNTGDEVWEVVKNYLNDPERKLMREYHAVTVGG